MMTTTIFRSSLAAAAIVGAISAPAFAQGTTAAPAIRAGEFVAAPYVEREGGPPNAGRIVGSGEVTVVPLTESERPLQSHERVFIVTPPGMAAAPGTRYLAVRRGPVIPNVGQIMLPTGVVVVERTRSGQATEARVAARFEPMRIGDELVTVPTLPTNLSRPSAQSAGMRTSVLWVEGDAVLPSLQFYLVLDGGSGSGLRVGDQVTFYREPRTTPDGLVLPESEIGVAQIVRVTPQAATAMIIDLSHAAIEEGTPGRVTARMP